MPDGNELYARDFYAWTQDQAARLRALNANALDTENLADEVESLGRADRRALISFLRLIASHCLKLELHPARRYRNHWRDEVSEFRCQLELVADDSPSLWANRAELYAKAWPQAVQEAARTFFKDELSTGALPERSAAPRYDLEAEILNEDWFPPPHPLD